MIHCKPKRSTYISLGIVVAILFAGLSYILHDFSTIRTYGLTFHLISASILTVVLLMLLVKMMAGYRFVSAGKGNITVRLPLRGMKKHYTLADILVWQEEIVHANKKEFRQLTIVFDDKNSISISNHEHINYVELYRYLVKKVPKKKVKP
ncbi:hypothetical protein DN752_06390 [Echinicola strongylocentroti]|uniref:PH domain-containing protein n=1 Tax=Echinicola strongylocentroti TaxID=1795355 RepID=A0A2Z4IGT0_9BACT|nr:hypothetical protein [Echinicola strongylocentroti]AWW29776.1 hypothetical protein DN752_06390 [Echinicola strongylocentroti]